MEQETIVITEEPQVMPEKRFSWKGMLKGAMAWMRSLLTKDGLKRMLPWLLVLLCVCTFAYECTNYYKTPIKYSVKISNQEKLFKCRLRKISAVRRIFLENICQAVKGFVRIRIHDNVAFSQVCA